MYQSVPSLTIPQANPRGSFCKGEFPTPGAQRMCETPTPGAGQIVLKPHPGGNHFQKSSKKKTKDETEITEMLICLEILKQ